MPIIRVAHEAVDLKMLPVPLACPMRWSAEGCHGHFRTTPRASRPGLIHVSRVAEESDTEEVMLRLALIHAAATG